MLNSFQYPSCLTKLTVHVEKWTLKQVQGDDVSYGGPGFHLATLGAQLPCRKAPLPPSRSREGVHCLARLLYHPHMPLNLTKIAFGAKSYEDLEGWYQGRTSIALTTRYRPTRFAEMAGGSLYWILQHAIVARSPLIGFSETADGRWAINLEPQLIRVAPKAKRAHQGWRYLKPELAPRDLDEGELAGDVIPGKLLRKLSNLGLV